MDLGAFLQENRRWLLGCGLGAAVFFIARGVIGSVYDPDPDRGAARRTAQGVQSGESYDSAALTAAQQERARLQQERARLERELAYEPDPAFQFEGKGLSPDEFLGKVGRDTKIRILRAANERDVQVSDRDLSWPPAPQGTDEIRAALFGIELVDAVCARLYAAHDAARQQDPQAEGLVAIAKVAVEQKRKARRPVLRPGQPSGADLDDLFDQERVLFEFRADEAVIVRFLESLRRPGKTLTLEHGLKVNHSGRRGDPVIVKGAVLGISLRPGKETD
ncbi:MAG: hypothetical protein AB7O97_00535 [Planctomycetota bacterium]